MTRFLERSADASVVWGTIRRLSGGSLVCAAIVAVMRPSLSYLGGAVPHETDEESRVAIERMWAIVADSVPGRAGLRSMHGLSDAWRHSRAVRAYAPLRALEAHRHVQLIGWIVLIAVLVSGAARIISPERWPVLSILIWAVVFTGAVGLVVKPRQVLEAWKAYRRSR
jgi:hypothetical protein